jgi:SNF2 family DNA or RNA helicase
VVPRGEVMKQQPAWQELENYKLREYQARVTKKFKDTNAVLIGDDMGLGKTLEAIDLDWKRRREFARQGKAHGPTLILTRMSIISEWEDHYEWMFKTFDDGSKPLRVGVLQPKDRASFLKAVRLREADVYIMHWDALRLLVDPKKDPSETMRKTQWFHIIGDEIHYVKNRKAQVTRALKKLKTQYKTGLSGTPADNKPADLWSILNWLYPQNFRSYWNFYKAYVKYEVDEIHGYHKVVGVRNVAHLHKQLQSFYIRRRKEEVAKELPEKYYHTRWVDLSPTQRRAYNDMKRNMLAWVGEHEGQPMAAPTVITQLLRLQQFSVASVDIEGPITVRRRSKNYNPKLVAKFLWDTHQVGVRPEDVDLHLKLHPELIKTLPTDRRYHKWYEEDVMKYVLADPSTKLDEAMEIVEGSDEPLVFFSQFKSMINLFGQRLNKAGISYGLLTGDTPQDARGTLVRNFQAGKLHVFAGTIAAGGEGITLTRSSHVTFFDRAWSDRLRIDCIASDRRTLYKSLTSWLAIRSTWVVYNRSSRSGHGCK